jgi:NADH-quinone oxidoreductase subunit F
MSKTKSPEDLESLRESVNKTRDPERLCITVCSGTGCHAYGCEKVTQAFVEEIRNRDLQGKVDIRTTGCHGFCERGPIVVIHPQEVFYQRVKVEDVPDVVSETILKKNIVDRLLYVDPNTGKKITCEKNVPFYKKQRRIIFGNNALIDPNSIEDYIALGGYTALSKVLGEMEPLEVIDVIKKSGLRGRGGGGFPTGKKWELCRNAEGEVRYVICNADEGDPGAYMDRSLLEGNPHSVLEGMIIGAYAVGSHQGFIYVRNEYPLAVKNVTIAIQQAREF